MAGHLVTDVNPDLKRGVCSLCGLVDLYPNGTHKGKQYWVCGPESRERVNKRPPKVLSPEDLRRSENFRLLRLYGITIDDFDKMFLEQNGRCARCEKSADALKIRLAVDHCHKTGVVRKLLCPPCNTYLGKLEKHRYQLERDLLYLDTGSFESVSNKN
jgi:hypothetical protein